MSKVLNIFLTPFYLILIAISFTSCGGCESNKNVDLGGLNQGLYINSYFGFTMGVPDAWKVLDSKEIEQLMGEAKSKIGIDADSGSQESKDGFLNLFFGGQFEEEVGFEYSLLITAQDIRRNPELSDESRYLTGSVDELRQLYGGFIKSFPITMEPIAGETFHTIRYDIDYTDDVRFSQMIFVTARQNFLISFILTYDTQEQYRDLRTALDSIKFSNDD